MKEEQQPIPAYEAPRIETIEIEVEKGFTISDVNYHPWEDGGHLGDYEIE